MNLPYPIHLTQTARVRLAALAAGYVLTGAIGLHRYLSHLSIETLLGIIAIVVTWDGRRSRRSAAGFAVAGLVFALFYSQTAGKSLLFAAIALSLLSLLQPLAGKPGWTPVVCLLLLSPLFEYFSNVFSFPLRISLTQLAGHLLTVMGMGVRVEGNTLINGTTEFSVDPACMGLHMLTTSLLTGMILTGTWQRNFGRKLALHYIVALMTALLFFNLVSNLFRIVILVQFRIPPEAPMHAGAGIACFMLYVLAPAVWLTRMLVLRFGKTVHPETGNDRRQPITRPAFLCQLVLLTFITLVMVNGLGKYPNDNLSIGPTETEGYQTELLHDRIVKLTSSESLIYIKPIAGFYSPDHQPGICWTGSGYEFKQVQEKVLGGSMRYTARLEKDDAVLYSAWWYDSGISTTTSQLDWRWDAFRHSRRYALVNVTATSPARLESEIRKFTNRNPCHKMLLN